RTPARLRRQRQVRRTRHHPARGDERRRPHRADRPAADRALAHAPRRRSAAAMTEPRPRRGSLYLVPVALGEHTPWAHFLPAQAQAIAAGLRHFVVETARAARAHLKQLDYPHPLRETDIRELPAEAADA